MAGNKFDTKYPKHQPKAYHVLFLDQNSDRWEFIAEGLESGANSGTNFIIYRYDDAGILLGKSFEINRASGAIRFKDEYTFPIADGNPGE